MKKHLKIVAILLICAFMFTLAACGNSKSSEKKESGKAPEKATEPKIVYPEKPVRFVIPFGAGGANDVLARIAAEAAEEHLGKEIVIENRPGGGQIVGQTEVWNSPADGYTLLAINPGIIQKPLLNDTPYTYEDWVPVIIYNTDPEIIAVSADSPYKTLTDLIEGSKQKPLKVVTPGFGTNPHVCGMYIEKNTGAKFEYVHAESGAKESLMLVGGHVDVLINTTGSVLSLAEEGKVRILGVMSDKTTKYLEPLGVKTFKEQGYDLEYLAWRGVGVKKGTPQEYVQILHDAFKKGLEDPSVKEGFDKAGYPVDYKGGEKLKKFVDFQNEYMSELLKGVKNKK